MIELNKTQKSVLKVLKDTYKKDTVTRAEINALVKKKVIKNPSWLKSDKFKVGRGVYTLNVDDKKSESKSTEVKKISTDTKAAYVVSSLTDNVVPAKDTDFVNFGNYSDIRNIVKSKKFYPVFITGLSGNGKTLAVTQACAESKREMIRCNITIETDEDDLLGGYRLKDGQTVWQNGPVIEAMERGCTLLLDECDLGSNKLLALQPVLEGKGVFADQAAEVLESFMFRIKAFEDLALENFGVWSDEERRERAGFLLLALTTLPREEEAACLAATDAFERFTLLDNFLGKTESELSAKVALDGVFGDSAPRAPLPRSGDRISFFWTEEDGWWDCEVVERVAPGFYSVKWDVDGSITRVQLDDDNANRWRLVPRQRPPEQSERRKRG
mgnify:CR=1 FL=1